MTNQTVFLVSCGKRKSDVSCQAKDMYNSFRFQKLKSVAEDNNLKWYIMSAKYGLISPDETISPYDLCLSDCPADIQEKWIKNITEKLRSFDRDTVFFVVANNEYSKGIVPLLIDSGFCVSAPFIGKDEDFVAKYAQKALHVNSVKKLYENMINLAINTGGIRMFSECNGKMYWPQRGVYFIVDFQEKNMFLSEFPRIVRVGTHAVSKGSKSTLWHRLKTHKGTDDGEGNHRGSIFRLHVGNAIINKEGLQCNTWGDGQNANKETRERERDIEHIVSEYIGKLGVVVVDINDLPSATSARSFIEKNAIALLSSLNSSFNFSTTDWLGNYSPRCEITDSCMWNINYITSDFDANFTETFESYIDNTIENYKKYKGGKSSRE